MQVRELIEELQRLDPELVVYTYDTDYGPEEVEQVRVMEPGHPNSLFTPKEEHVCIS